MDVGKVLRHMRLACGYESVREAERAAGVSQGVLKTAEKKPEFSMHPDTRQKVLALYGCGLDEFVSRVALHWDGGPRSLDQMRILRRLRSANEDQMEDVSHAIKGILRRASTRSGGAGVSARSGFRRNPSMAQR